MKELTLKQFSSLEKVFLKPAPEGTEIFEATALCGEEFSYQIAYTISETCKVPVTLQIESPIAEFITIRLAENVPSELPVYEHDYDDDYLRTEPGLFPDILYPLTGNVIEAKFSRWHSLWISIRIPETFAAGTYPITVSFTNEEHKICEQKTLQLKIIGATMPKQEIFYTQWFNINSLADFYRVEPYSERHWELIDLFLKTAVDNGVNMILTPVIGRAQLADIFYDGANYQFDFQKLVRWIRLCKKHGIKEFEMMHLFTPVGAKNAVNVYVSEQNEWKLKFGKHTRADDSEYQRFLEQFLPALVKVLQEEDLSEKLWFHISDEPQKGDEEAYARAKKMVHDILNTTGLKTIRFMDALCDYSFYEIGALDHPVVAIDFLEPFLEHNVPELWGYNCCAQHTLVSNRFMAMPSYRNRIIGLQLYKYQLQGFLHWGYCHYYAESSGVPINPFFVTDAHSGWQSGDAFSVYPGENGPIESIRLKVFKEALQDIRALCLLEQYIGHEEVVALIEEETEKPLTFKDYPRNAEYILKVRNRINLKIEQAIK